MTDAIEEQSQAATQNEPGTPTWVDVSTRDVEAAKSFYSALFGWEAFSIPDPGAGGYGFFLAGGKQVAGFGPVQDPNAPPSWNIYIGTTDADETARKVQEAGGHVVMGPMDVMDAGRIAYFTDPTGAFLGAWQPGTMGGVEASGVPGSLAWAELNTRDIDAAKPFYAHVFGWTGNTFTEGDMAGYTIWNLGDRQIGGGMQMNENFPPEVPAHWLAYFTVLDTAASVERARELGAEILMPATPIPGTGIFAVLRDPQGAVIGLLGPGQ